MPRLLALPYSPWSEKARWALDHHKINYRETEYLPLLGTPLLRLRLRQLTGKVTVPVLFLDADTITDSYEIARYCDQVGSAAPLFPAGQEQQLARWNELSEQACHSARALATSRVAADEDALLEAVPTLIPRPLRLTVGQMGARYLEQKYDLGDLDEAAHRGRVTDALDALEDGLGQGPTLLAQFSFADIAMATALQLVSPVADPFIRLGRNTRRCMTDPLLAQRFARLVSWRDELYQRFR